MEPDVIEGGSSMDGNSICHSSVGVNAVVLLEGIPIVCPQSEELLHRRRPCRRSTTPASSATFNENGLKRVEYLGSCGET